MRLAGLTFVVQNGPAGDSEITAENEPDVEMLTLRNAETKLRAAVDATRNRIPWDTVVVAADTAVAVHDRPLGKPADRSEAEMMLRELRGREHVVVTSVAMTYAPHRQRGEVLSHSVRSSVIMREYGDDEIDEYIASGTPFDRAGAYGVQDSQFDPAESVIGCYLNVVGLPLCAVRALLPTDAGGFAASHVYVTCAAHERGGES